MSYLILFPISSPKPQMFGIFWDKEKQQIFTTSFNFLFKNTLND